MRCKQCGYINADDATRCVKCNCELKRSIPPSIPMEPMEPERTTLDAEMYGQQYNPSPSVKMNFAETTRYYEPVAQEPQPEVTMTGIADDDTECPDCGWIRQPGDHVCQRCGYVFEQKVEEPAPTAAPAAAEDTKVEDEKRFCSECGARVTTTAIFCHRCGSRLDLHLPKDADVSINVSFDAPEPVEDEVVDDEPTVLGGPTAVDVPKCTLCPVTWEDECFEAEERTYCGEQIELDRTNTDPGNNTISKELQAMLEYRDGEWYIRDCSKLRTSLLRLNRDVALEDGDVIILGNREFVFHS